MVVLAAYPDRVLAHDGDNLRVDFEGDVQCLDAGRYGVYCGTPDGVYRRGADAAWGAGDWTRVADVGDVTAVRVHESGVWAGTEPSAVYHAPDGESFAERPGLTDLSSADSWAFPPRPSTHHVRWIEPTSSRLYVAVEAGALVRSPDRGDTWLDRVPSGPRDTHSMATHADHPGLAYAAAGDGFFVTTSGGDAWHTEVAGLDRTYCWSVVRDPGDPGRVLVSAAHGARTAHDAGRADSAVFRRDDRTGDWTRCSGLPGPDGLLAPVLATTGTESEAYAATNHGVFRTDDWGDAWSRLPGDWPDGLESERATGLVVV